MKVLRFGPEAAEHVDRFASDFSMVHLHQADRTLSVGCMYIPAGGCVGRHQAALPQLFMVVQGEGWVAGADEQRRPIRSGEAALWEVDEWHEAGSDSGMTAVVVEYRGGGPIRRFDIRDTRWTVYLASGNARERAAGEQLERLLSAHDLRRWTFTRDVRIEQGAVPHSHPVLTLNTKYLEQDGRALAVLLHEQFHWYADAQMPRVEAAIGELREAYPSVPVGAPEGAQNERSSYLHLIINSLEYDALVHLLGPEAARGILQGKDAYTWIYRTVLADLPRIRHVIQRHGLGLE